MAIAYDIRDSGSRAAQGPAQSREQLEADLELHRKWMLRISDACERVASGDLEVRLLGCDTGGDIQRAARGLNHLLDVTDAFVREAKASLDAASQGRFHRRFLVRGMPGSFRQAAMAINGASDEMQVQAKALSDAGNKRRALADTFEAHISGIVGTVVMGYFFRRDTSRES